MAMLKEQGDPVPLTHEERRARREARRIKQRDANVSRAAAMHAARTAPGVLPALPPTEPPSINVGCSGWFYWHWKELFYGATLPTNQWFEKYRGHFPTVELNAPFYSWPTINSVSQWLRQVRGGDFVYTVKVCELITHVKRFVGTKTLLRDFGYIADLLGSHMGCFLFQLLPSYDFTPSRLKSIVGQLEPSRRNVVEFRHKSWWNEKVYDAFRQTGTIFCSCSAPRLPADLVKTADEVYLRFHGPKQWYRHYYSGEELLQWQTKIRESNCRRVWAYFNNDREGHSVTNAREFTALLSLRADNFVTGSCRD